MKLFGTRCEHCVLNTCPACKPAGECKPAPKPMTQNNSDGWWAHIDAQRIDIDSGTKQVALHNQPVMEESFV